jgi:hypothetical protein
MNFGEKSADQTQLSKNLLTITEKNEELEMKQHAAFVTLVVVFSYLILIDILPAYGQDVPFDYSIVVPGVSSQARAVGDIDGDGRGDLVVVEGEFDPNVFAWFEYPNWTRHDMNDESLAGFDYVADCKLADLDNDGDLDFIFPDSQNGGDKAKQVLWFENPLPDGDVRGEWPRHVVKNLGPVTFLKEIAVGYFDDDEKLDIVARAEDRGYIFFQNDPDDWTVTEIAFRPHEGLEVGDLDRDGDTDFILNGAWWRNPGNARAEPWTEFTFDDKWYTQDTGSWMDNNCQVRLGDIDDDGCVDIVVSSSEQKGYPVSWYRAPVDPAGGKWIEHQVGQLDYCHSLQVADMDNDGDLDIMAGEMVKGEDPDRVVVYFQEGHPRLPGSWKDTTPTFREQNLSTNGAYWAVIGDVGGDGDLDVVGSRSYNEPPIEMWENKTSDNKLSLNKWQYIQLDDNRPGWGDYEEPKWKAYFGLTAGDLNNDRYSEVVTGRFVYVNPGGDMSNKWQRVDFGRNMDAQLITDVDGDEFGDVIAVHCRKQLWVEATDKTLASWKIIEISDAPICMYGGSSQGYHLAQIIPGGKPEIILTDEDNGIYFLQIPDNPETEKWPWTKLTDAQSTGEGLASADMDGDGDIDICSSVVMDGKGNLVAWWENPGNGEGGWKQHAIGMVTLWADRFEIADLNNDGMLDVVVADELCCPGEKPIVHLYWFEQFSYYKGQRHWQRHSIVQQYSMNSLDAADIDRDGDIDLITGEHKGPAEKVEIWENDGRGQFTARLVDTGKESHLGTQLHDLDGDGDLDIISIAWDESENVHLWRNDAVVGKKAK